MPYLDLLKYWRGGLIALLCGLCVTLYVLKGIEQRRSAKLQVRVNELVGELQRISTAKDEQRAETERNIAEGGNGRKRAETIARRIEAAPTVGGCKTPPEIMGADL